MFEATNTDGGITVVNVSFWQCVKAGAGVTIGAALVWTLSIVITWVAGLSLLGLLAALLSHK
jgi:hypothetical protein